jgi:hypothetical protein
MVVVVAQARETTEPENTTGGPEVARLGHKEGTKSPPLRNVAKMIRKNVEAPGVEHGACHGGDRRRVTRTDQIWGEVGQLR